MEPKGEVALLHHDSISWRIFKNPVTLFVGGVAAVLLELAEPRVRTAVWEQSQFRSQALRRVRRTGLAALATVYGSSSAAEEMISHIVRLHENVRGATPKGQEYCASDPELLRWVHATATFGFFQAYSQYVCPLQHEDMDSFCREGLISAGLYGAINAPASHQDMQALFQVMEDLLEPSPILFDFLNIIKSTPILPAILRPLQGTLVRAAVALVPQEIRQKLGLADSSGLTSLELGLVKSMGRISDRTLIESNPAVQACVRLGLPSGYLYQQQ
ncbi:MAG: oxygenase MpaB family protein [Formivibrio sp.]|nr:oxygenase MpaB family protein [Formivibrio sp.]